MKVDPDINKKRNMVNYFCSILNNGYTYNEIQQEILDSFNNNRSFNFNLFKQKTNKNIITQGVMYYHKELKLMSQIPKVNVDINSGTITSEEVEYYLEEVASYTIDETINYLFSKGIVNQQEYNHKRLYGIFKHYIDKYGIDKVLFMIEGAYRDFQSDKKMFSINNFESYNTVASSFLEDIKNNCKYSGGDKYVPRRRKLFN